MAREADAQLTQTFEELLARHVDALYRMALRLCGGHCMDAEDLVQDAALRALRGFRSLREPLAGRSWLFTILLRTHVNRGRSAGRRAERLSTDLDEREFEQALAAWTSVPLADERMIVAERGDRLVAALDELEAPLRAAVWLVDVEGFRQREAAVMLGVPEGTVASRVFRARRRLRDALAEPTARSVVGRIP